ncbi:ABC transporter permease [Micromonospora parva]
MSVWRAASQRRAQSPSVWPAPLTWKTVKGRKGGFVAAFVAVLFGSAVITACGILLESSERSGVPTERYRAADLVVGASQALPVADDVDPRFGERATLPASRVGDVARVPGVRSAIAEVNVPVSLVTADAEVLAGPDGTPALGHGWQSAALGPFTTITGRAPAGPDDVVLDSALAERAGVTVGAPVRLAVGSNTSMYRVTAIASLPGGRLARQSALFFTDDRARELTGQPERVDAIGVLAAPGVSADELASAIKSAVPDAVVYTGSDRSEAEFLDIGTTRSFISELSLAFGGSMIVVIVMVVASTLALSVRQRLRELALLRAIGATPKQVLGMIAAETMVVGTLGAVLGVIPGIGLSFLGDHPFDHGHPPGCRAALQRDDSGLGRAGSGRRRTARGLRHHIHVRRRVARDRGHAPGRAWRLGGDPGRAYTDAGDVRLQRQPSIQNLLGAGGHR